MAFSDEQVEAFRQRIRDTADDPAFSADELRNFLEQAVSEHTDGERSSANMTSNDWPMALLLGHHSAILALGTDERKYFKWADAEEDVDKDKISEKCVKIADQILKRYNSQLRRRQQEEETAEPDEAAGEFWKMRR